MGIAAPEAPQSPATSAELPRGAGGESPWRRFVAEFAESGLAMAGLVLLVALVLLAIAAPYISPQNPYDLSQLDVLDSRLAPGEHSSTSGKPYWLG
ncbi:MAG TPA: hypothetical protein VF386_10850, partial [Usitatibacter sp.]